MTVAAYILITAIIGQVVLRGSDHPDPRPILAVSGAGVELGGDNSQVIGWQRVKLVQGDFSAQARAYQKLADALWRGGARLARGDAPGAEGLFAAAFGSLQGSAGPSVLFAAEGLAESRRRQGESARAVAPWLAALQLRRRGVAFGDDGRGGLLIIDGQTGLTPGLPPIWVPMAELSDLADPDLGKSITDMDRAVGALLSLYQQAARFELNLPEPPDRAAIDSDAAQLPGIQLVRQIVLSRIGSPEQRSEARQSLIEALPEAADPSSGQWTEAWRRIALGRSLVHEDDPKLRDEGLIQLMQLPARFARSDPYLTGLALAEMAAEARRRGWVAASDTLEHELDSTYPWHPAAVWLRAEHTRLGAGPERQTSAQGHTDS